MSRPRTISTACPYRFARAEVDVRLTARAVEVFLRGERIAAHRRGSGDGKHTTVPDHMPSSHRRYAGWTIERINRDAAAIGPTVGALCTLILERRPHPEQGFRACLGILKLERSVGAARLDAAAGRAIEIGALTYGSVKSILDNKLEQQPTRAPQGRSGADPSSQHPRQRLFPLIAERTVMLTHPTHDRLQQLGLLGMARAFGEILADPDSASLSHAEWLALLLEHEISHRHDRRLTARLRYAKLRHQAAVEDVDYRAARGLDRALFQEAIRRRLDRRP